MNSKSLALAGALLGATAVSAHASVIGTVGFADMGTPMAAGSATGDINAATAFTIGDLLSSTARTGLFGSMSQQDLGTIAFETTSADSLTFGNSVFGTFTSTAFVEKGDSPRSLVLYVLGDWTPGTEGGVSPGSYAASLTIAFTQTPAHAGSISDSATFAIPPAGVPELSTWAMMGLGFAALGFAGFRAHRKSATFAA